MSGFFGIVSQKSCATDLFYGIDYHSHLGTKRAGMVTIEDNVFHRSIHDIESSYFRTKFADEMDKFVGSNGIGVISDTDPQPIVVNSHLGRFGIVTVGRINNLRELEQDCLDRGQQFTELSMGLTNPTELVALLISQGKTFADGIRNVYQKVKGSCSMLILTSEGIIAARDYYGRTPIVIGRNEEGYAVASESHSYINLGFETCRFVDAGEAVMISTSGIERIVEPNPDKQTCSFLWIYYGYPDVDYEGINTESCRYKFGYEMGKNDDVEADFVSAIPDSGIGMALGYAEGRQIPYKRGVVKYTPTWSRSFMPVNQEQREFVAKMKLLPNKSVLEGKDIVFCDDSIVRGTQLRNNVKMLYDYGAKRIHIRISCPPLVFGCPYLNFSASKTEMELITLRIINELEGGKHVDLTPYCDHTTLQYASMVEKIRQFIGVDSLKFNSLDVITDSIGLNKQCICTHCFDGSSHGE